MNAPTSHPVRYLNSRRNVASEPATENRAGSLATAAVFALGVGVMWLSPLSRVALFPYKWLAAQDGSRHWHRVLTDPQAIALNAGQWIAATVIFAVLARQERTVLLAPLTLAGLTLVTIAMHTAVRLLGLDFYSGLPR